MFFADRLHAEPEDRNTCHGIVNPMLILTGSMRSLRIEMSYVFGRWDRRVTGSMRSLRIEIPVMGL